MAKWDESEDEEEAEEDLDGVVWLGGFEGFADLCELIFDSCTAENCNAARIEKFLKLERERGSDEFELKEIEIFEGRVRIKGVDINGNGVYSNTKAKCELSWRGE